MTVPNDILLRVFLGIASKILVLGSDALLTVNKSVVEGSRGSPMLPECLCIVQIIIKVHYHSELVHITFASYSKNHLHHSALYI